MIKQLINTKLASIEEEEKRKAEQKKKDIECIWKNAIESLKPTSFGDGKLSGRINLFVEDRYVNVWDVLRSAENEGLTVIVGAYVAMGNIEAVDFFYFNDTIEVWGSLNVSVN